MPSWHRLVLSAAAEEDRCWRPYEFRPIELGKYSPPTFASFEPSAAVDCSSAAKQALTEVVAGNVATGDAGGGEGEECEEGEAGGAGDEESESLDLGCARVQTAVAEVLEVALSTEAEVLLASEAEVEAIEAEAEAAEAETLLALEIQLW